MHLWFGECNYASLVGCFHHECHYESWHGSCNHLLKVKPVIQLYIWFEILFIRRQIQVLPLPVHSITLIFLDMLNVYKMYNELLSSSISGSGPRSVKRETPKHVNPKFCPLLPKLLTRTRGAMIDDFPHIFGAVFSVHPGDDNQES